jgi:hypothetical protein
LLDFTVYSGNNHLSGQICKNIDLGFIWKDNGRVLTTAALIGL